MKVGSSTELQPSFRVTEANQKRVVLRARRPAGSLRCCGPLAVALATLAGFGLFFLMQGYETVGWGGQYQCIPFGIGIIGLGLTAINLIELLHREEVVFDRLNEVVTYRESFVPGVLTQARWKLPFSEVQAVLFGQVRECSWTTPIWSVGISLLDGKTIGVDRASDRGRMLAVANYLATFLRVQLIME